MQVRPALWLLLLAGALVSAVTVAPAGAVVSDVNLTPRGHTDLPSPGLDGQTKPRGKNGSVAILKDRAYVGGGQLFSGARSTNGRVCTDYGGVKVVDISSPDNPSVTNTITIQDPKNLGNPYPAGNVRRPAAATGLKIDNVGASVSAVDAITHAPAGKDILALVTQRCEPAFFNGGQLELWDVSNPSAPSRISIWTGPPGKEWGIFEDLRMFTRADKPGKVYAMLTSPFSSGNTHDAIVEGEFRLLDITDPAAPVQIGGFPTESIGSNSNNGCRIFYEGRSAAPTPDGKHAIFSYADGPPPAPAVPGATSDPPTGLGGPDTAAVFDLDLDNLPVYQPNTGPAFGNPISYLPKPPSWGYAPAADGGLTAGGQIAPEGNAADVQPFTGPGGELLTFVSEEDWDPATTNVTIDTPGPAFTRRGCHFYFGDKVYLKPGQQVSDDVAYVGRGCPAGTLDGTSNQAADPYIEDPNGKIAVFDSPNSPATATTWDGCSAGDRIKRAADAGAVGTMFALGCCPLLNNIIPGPQGGLPEVPSVATPQSILERMAAQFPNRFLTSATFPTAAWNRTSATNATARQFALPVTGATAATPIQITATAHGLTTGQKVKIAGVQGVNGANGEFTITSTGANTFTLDGSVGSGAYTRGGTVVGPCLGAGGACSASPARTDVARFKSVANVTDRAARIQTNATIVTLTAAAPALATTLQVAPLPAALASGTPLRFANGTDNAVQASLTSAAAAGDTTLNIGGQVFPTGGPGNGALQAPIPNGTKGSPAPEVIGGRQYNASAFLEVESRSAGAYRAAVVWYDSSGAQIGPDSEIESLSTATPRTRFVEPVTAPANAIRAAMKFEWTDPAAEGVAFADAFALVPTGLHATLRDEQGAWGSQRIIDFSQNPPVEVGSYQSPGAKAWPPPNDGIFAPSLARMFGNDVAFTTWLSDGLRVLDVSDPANPKQRARFQPPDTADPSATAGAGPSPYGGSGSCMYQLNPPASVSAPCLQRRAAWPARALANGVEVVPQSATTGLVAVTDINSGLYLLSFNVNRSQAGGPSAPSRGYYLPPGPGQGGSSAFAGCPSSSSNVISGTAGPNALTGTSAGDRIFAGAGNDRVSALGGRDCVDLGPGADRGGGGSGSDLILGRSGADRIAGGSSGDRLRGESGADRVSGNSGNDNITGGASGDRLSGGAGRDRISGNSGRDRMNGDSGRDRVSGNGGRDRLRGGSGRDRISGGSGNDRISARDGAVDRINCGSGRDRVSADSSDIVNGNCERVRRASASSSAAGAASLGGVPGLPGGAFVALLAWRRRS